MSKLFLLGLFLCFFVDYSSSKTLKNLRDTIHGKTSSKFIAEGDQGFDVIDATPKPDPNLKTVPLDDPDNCLSNCSLEYAIDLINATLLPSLDILSDILNTTDLDSNVTLSDADEKKLLDSVIGHLGDVFVGMCDSSKSGVKCIEKCKKSKSVTVAKVDYASGLSMCAVKKFPNATEFLKALDCINSSQAENTCEAKCGTPLAFSNITELDIDDDTNLVHYISDTKQNTANINNACKIQTCYIECAEPIIVKACGQLSADAFKKMITRENKVALEALKSLGAVDDISCGGNSTTTQ